MASFFRGASSTKPSTSNKELRFLSEMPIVLLNFSVEPSQGSCFKVPYERPFVALSSSSFRNGTLTKPSTSKTATEKKFSRELPKVLLKLV